jgi:PleD family two-component response regulator
MALEQITLKILVVDQLGFNYALNLVDSLNDGGFNVDFCSDPETNFRKLKNSARPVDLLIIDLASIQDTDALPS